MVKTIAAENVARGITANAVLPGLVATENVRGDAATRCSSARVASAVGPHGEPEEVAALVAYLCSEEAGYVTGQEIGVDGGAWLNTFSLTRERAGLAGSVVPRRVRGARGFPHCR